MVGVRGTLPERAIWHDVECGAYTADLPLWRELAGRQACRVLDLGAGTGRVALDLAGGGHRVTAVDLDPNFTGELAARGAAAGLELAVHTADAREVRLGETFELVLAPMQLVQLMGGGQGRAQLLATLRAHLAPGGRAALAIAASPGDPVPDDAPVPLPDVREIDGWVFSSTPVTVRRARAGFEIVRHRQVVAPDGTLRESEDVILLESCTPELVEQEAVAAGLMPAGRRLIAETADHVGSVVVLLEAA
jgi:SAM-dependent methyltransferase